MESNALEKSKNSSLALRLFAPIPAMIWWIIRNYYLVGRWKTVLNFPKNFHEFRFDTIEKYDIINLSSYSSKSYASEFLVIPKLPSLGKRRIQSFVLFSIVLYLYTALHDRRSMSSNFLVFRMLTPGNFLLLIFFNTASISSSISHPHLISSRQLIILFDRIVSDFRKGYQLNS